MVEALVKNAVINHKNEAGETPLTLAIKNGNSDIIKLVSKRAKAALKNDAGETPLFLAIGLGDMYLFLPNDNGDTPLYIATKNGYDLVAGILVSKSEDPIGDTNWKTRIGTPLIHIAAKYGSPEVISVLANNGADIESPDFMENTALSVAAKTGNSPNIRALVQSNANINHQNIQGDTPLMLASTNFQDNAVNLLLSSGADATVRNNMGYAAADFYSTNVFDGLFAQKGVKQQIKKKATTKKQPTASTQTATDNREDNKQ